MMKFLSVLLLTSLLTTTTLAAPDAELLPQWTATQADSSRTIDHSEWQRFLDSYLQRDRFGQHYFAYRQVSEADARQLKRYLTRLGDARPRDLNRNEQMAYWLNLYNAATVDLILDHYPVDSIRKIKGGWFNTGPWDEPLVGVGDEQLSLNDIEHGILRPIWRDPRIHYAVNCASLGCPNLPARAVTAENLETQLETAARQFVNHTRGVRFEGNKLTLSSIYKWYSDDFGADQDELIEHLRQYAKPKLGARLDGYRGRIDYDYDWSLNEVE